MNSSSESANRFKINRA